MAIPTSGAFSASDINIELGKSSGTSFSASASDVRNLAGDTSGEYSASAFRGKSSFSINLDDSSFSAFYQSPTWHYMTVTLDVNGGVAPLSYDWDVGAPFSYFSKSGNNMTFRYYVSASGYQQAVLSCTVTDSAGSSLSTSANTNLNHTMDGGNIN
jgi:hypothetical protein